MGPPRRVPFHGFAQDTAYGGWKQTAAMGRLFFLRHLNDNKELTPFD
jgi:hypothetical protein